MSRGFVTNVLFLCLFISATIFPRETSAQVYGLAFRSHSFLKEERTLIDLNPDKYFVFEDSWRLKFEFRLQPGENMYFGYIVRLVDGNGKNIDLIYNHQSSERNSFEIIPVRSSEEYSLRTDFDGLCTEWIEISLDYDPDTRELSFSALDTVLTIKDLILDKRIRFVFGASDLDHFKTTDVPPMILRDITISNKNRIIHDWSLNESEGNLALDKTGKINARVVNPDWLNPKHADWIKISGGKIAGIAEIAFNPASEQIYVIGDKHLLSISIPGKSADTIRYNNFPEVLKAGCQAFYDQRRNVIVSYNPDVKTVATFDLNTRFWTQTTMPFYPLTVYWHHNKLFAEEDSTILIFGGYGQHEYKNSIQRYHFPTGKWDQVIPDGEVYPPRYLASSGRLNDTVYFLGGYGSYSGKQIMNPRSYNDFWGYIISENRFFKKYDFTGILEDAAFSNSLIIDPETGYFYALTYPIFKFETFLQLIRGSLSRPEIIPVGQQIPYLFHDIVSFSDLFYCPISRQLACVTLLADENGSTEFSVFTIGFPPNQVIGNKKVPEKKGLSLLYLITVVLMGLILFFIFTYRKKSRQKLVRSLSDSKAGMDTPLATAVSDKSQTRIRYNSVLFFGDFQIFDNKGGDITIRFSPLLRELFLLIWFYSIGDKGISSEKIKEILWFDKDEKSAKNNLAVNITKLKHHLAGLDTLELSHQTGYWKFTFDDRKVYNDYTRCLTIIHLTGHHVKDKIRELIRITQEGNFLASSNHEWLDGFKASFSNAIIDHLINYSLQFNIEEDSDLALHLADAIMKADILNEEALKLKCKALVLQGKHALSKEAYGKFARDYQILINIPYSVPFVEIIR